MINIISGAFFILSGIAGLFLGTMFLIASDGSASRLAAGIIFFAAGAGMTASGFYLLRKGLKGRPGSVEKLIMAAAAKHNGTISAKALSAETGGGEAVEFKLAAMVRSGRALVENISGKKIYKFPEVQFTLRFKKCPYCSNDYPVRENIEKCPSCGGDLKIVSERTSDGDGRFSMDM
jgi:rRNA maturation protein Nop10